MHRRCVECEKETLWGLNWMQISVIIPETVFLMFK